MSKQKKTGSLLKFSPFLLSQERIKAWQHWQHCTSSLNKKREAKARAELQHRSDKVATLRQDIAENERQQELAQENFDKISKLIKKEVCPGGSKKYADF